MEITYRHHEPSSRLELRLARLVKAQRTRRGHAFTVDLVRNVDMEFIFPII